MLMIDYKKSTALDPFLQPPHRFFQKHQIFEIPSIQIIKLFTKEKKIMGSFFIALDHQAGVTFDSDRA
jgi:hypothetical protein